MYSKGRPDTLSHVSRRSYPISPVSTYQTSRTIVTAVESTWRIEGTSLLDKANPCKTRSRYNCPLFSRCEFDDASFFSRRKYLCNVSTPCIHSHLGVKQREDPLPREHHLQRLVSVPTRKRPDRICPMSPADGRRGRQRFLGIFAPGQAEFGGLFSLQNYLW